jgi:hypothetical protein
MTVPATTGMSAKEGCLQKKAASNRGMPATARTPAVAIAPIAAGVTATAETPTTIGMLATIETLGRAGMRLSDKSLLFVQCELVDRLPSVNNDCIIDYY